MVLLNLLAALALLLWGARQMERASRDLAAAWEAEVLAPHAARGPYSAWMAGLVAGLLHPQENAVWRGVQLAQPARLPAARTQAAILGGTVGCALTVLAFARAPAWAFHVLLIAGAAAWNTDRAHKVRAAGRALFGAGVVLLGLEILAIASLRSDDALVAALARALEEELLLAATFGMLAALLLRSVFAAVLLLAAFGAWWLPAGAALALLAGVHVGGAIAGYSRAAENAFERRLVTGHVLAMLLAAAALLLVLPDLLRLMARTSGLDLAVANLAFCGLAAAVLLNFAGPLARLVERRLPQPPATDTASAQRRLDTADLDEPSLALSSAVRQVMRLADLVGGMLQRATVAILQNDREAIAAVCEAEEEADGLYSATKHYLARIPHRRLSGHEQQRWDELIVFLIALEQIADAVDRMLPRSQAWNGQHPSGYPPAAQAEFRALHGLLTRNLQMAAGLCLERRAAAATTLLAAEEEFRKLERSLCGAHLARVVAADAASIAVSELHLDLLADLAQMNARLCGFARFFLELQEDDAKARASKGVSARLAKPAHAARALALHSGKDPGGIASLAPPIEGRGLD